MIRILQNAVGRKAAILVCDICLKPIEDASLAAAVFKGDAEVGEVFEVLHAHKGICHDEAERRLGGKSQTGWHEMKAHLVQVCHNSKSPVAALAKLDAMFDGVGQLP